MVRDTVTPFISRMGEAGTYTAPGGAAVAFSGIADDLGIQEVESRDGRDSTEHLTVRVSSGVIAAPVRGATVSFRDRTDWSVRDIRQEPGQPGETLYFWALDLVRRTPTERTSEGRFSKVVP